MKTIDQLKNAVVFTKEPLNDFHFRIIGTLTLHQAMTIDKESMRRYPIIQEEAEKKIKEKIIRELYEDGRVVLSEMLFDLMKCDPCGYEFGQKINEVIAMAKRIEPNLLDTNTPAQPQKPRSDQPES